jgi:rhamnosyltransferase subunit B
MRRRIVLTTFGSLGDLHPYIAVALGLRERGHDAVIATSEIYRAKVEGEGLPFHPVRPDAAPLLNDPEVVRKSYDVRRGTEYIIREIALPNLEATYEDLLAAVRGADLVASHPLAYALPLAAEKLGVRWMSVALQPAVFLSTWDPPVIAAAPWLRALRRLGRLPYSAVFHLGLLRARSWAEPVVRLRAKLGLPPPRAHPLLAGMFSPFGTLAWFSRVLAAPQPDWPPHTRITGFPFYDKEAPDSALDPGLARFLDSGEPPIVFTLGSSAVMQAGSFYSESLAAVEALGARAVLLLGPHPQNRPAARLPESVFAAAYAPYSALLPRASAIVHQGGVGTTAQALRAGRPMLVVPFSHDQPDNAERVRRLGVARVLARNSYRADAAAGELRRILGDPAYARSAAAIGARVRAEDGVKEACDALELSFPSSTRAG